MKLKARGCMFDTCSSSLCSVWVKQKNACLWSEAVLSVVVAKSGQQPEGSESYAKETHWGTDCELQRIFK